MAELADRFLLSMRRKGEERRVVVILSENCGGCGKTSEKKPQTTSEYCFATSPSLSPGQRAILFIYFHSWWWWSWLVIDSPEMWRIVSHLSPPHKVKLYQYPAPIGHLTVWQIWHHVTKIRERIKINIDGLCDWLQEYHHLSLFTDIYILIFYIKLYYLEQEGIPPQQW